MPGSRSRSRSGVRFLAGPRARIAAALFVTLFFSYCYFLQNPRNANTVPRIALGISMIEEGSLAIDKYRFATVDLASYEGRYYSEKAPGLTIMSLPAIELVGHYVRAGNPGASWLGFSGIVNRNFDFLVQWAVITTSALITALAGVALYYFALRLGAGLSGAVFASLAYGLATPAWGWATAFFSHAAAGGFLFFGFLAVYSLAHSAENRRRDALLGLVSGALLAWAAVLEMTSAGAAAIITLYGLWSVRGWERGRLLRALVPAVAGAVVFVSPLLIYNYAVTGSPFESLYKYSVYFPDMREGVGVSRPELHKLVKLLIGKNIGILYFAPILLAAPYALYRLSRLRGGAALAVTAAAVAAYYLIWNSSFAYWTGGHSTGPRYLTPMLPFLCLPMAVLWAASGRAVRGALLTLFAVSFAVSLVCVSVSMTLPPAWPGNMFTDVLYPRFALGEGFKLSFPASWLLSHVLDPAKSGHLALLPLLAVLALSAAYIIREIRSAGDGRAA